MENGKMYNEVCRYCKHVVFYPLGNGEYKILCGKELAAACRDFEFKNEPIAREA